jgi:hypothetical protein
MPLDQRQRAFADRAETDHDEWAGDAGMNGPFGHCLVSNGYGVISAQLRG